MSPSLGLQEFDDYTAKGETGPLYCASLRPLLSHVPRKPIVCLDLHEAHKLDGSLADMDCFMVTVKNRFVQ